MSRRNRHREAARRAKYLAPQVAIASPALPAGPGDLEDRILGVLTPWRGDAFDGGATTGEIASQLFIRPRSPERQELNDALTSMRRAGLVKFEFDRMLDQQARWWRRA